eukprot:scaffold2788_cov376-Prasinococcus_capsulatus_cf.AAC.3
MSCFKLAPMMPASWSYAWTRVSTFSPCPADVPLLREASPLDDLSVPATVSADPSRRCPASELLLPLAVAPFLPVATCSLLCCSFVSPEREGGAAIASISTLAAPPAGGAPVGPSPQVAVAVGESVCLARTDLVGPSAIASARAGGSHSGGALASSF